MICIVYVFLWFVAAIPCGNHINQVVSHPTLPITVTAHEDRHIKFFDNKSGEWCVVVVGVSVYINVHLKYCSRPSETFYVQICCFLGNGKTLLLLMITYCVVKFENHFLIGMLSFGR